MGSARERLRRLEMVTNPGLARLGVEQLLAELLDRVRELLSVDTTAVLLLDPSRCYLLATAARGLEEEVRQGVRIPLGQGFAGRIAAEKRPVVIDNVDHSNVLNPILRQTGIRSLLGVPLMVGGRVLGVLHVGTLSARRFTEDDTELLQLVADRAALALQAQMAVTDRAAAVALQRSLLPGPAPAIEDIRFASRYVPGGGGQVAERGQHGGRVDLGGQPVGGCPHRGDDLGGGAAGVVVPVRHVGHVVDVVGVAVDLGGQRVDRQRQRGPGG